MGDGLTSTQVATVAGGTAVVSGAALATGAAGVTISVTVPTTVALAGGGTAVLGTTFTAGAANFWNPVGWALLIVAAVIAIVAIGIWIYENWDAICEFFSGIWAWLTEKATIVYEWVVDTAVPWITDTAIPWIQDTAFPWVATTIAQTWESVVSIPVPTVQRRYKRGMKNLTKLLGLAIGAKILLPKDDAVYKITMLVAGDYDLLIWGKPTSTYSYIPEVNSNVYKYGTTKNGIEGRYVAGSYVYTNIMVPPKRMEDSWIVENKNFYEARIIEKAYIFGHFMQWFYYPPGNSKLG